MLRHLVSPGGSGVTHERRDSDCNKAHLSQSGLQSKWNNREESRGEYEHSSCVCVGWEIAGEEAKTSRGREEERGREEGNRPERGGKHVHTHNHLDSFITSVLSLSPCNYLRNSSLFTDAAVQRLTLLPHSMEVQIHKPRVSFPQSSSSA